MKLENGEISNSQLMRLVLSFLQSMILTINFAYAITKHDTWIAVLAAFAIAVLIALVYTGIAKKFPGQNLVQINDIVFGRYLGKLISALYIWYFFQLIIHYMYFFNSFWITFIMPETPRAAFLVMFTFVCAMAVRKGLEVITRLTFSFITIVTISLLTVTVLLIRDMKLINLLPVFEISIKDFIQGVHIILAIPLCDIVVFLMILPYTADKQKIIKPVLVGLSLSVVQLMIVVLRDTAVLGPRLLVVSSASYAAIRQIDVANVLTRLDILVAVTLLITVFMKISIFYYVTVLSTAQILKLNSYKPLVIPIGAIAAAIAANLYPSDMEQVYAGTYVWPFNAFIGEFLLPIMTIIIIAIRRLPKKEGEKAS
ncbi:MAG TPA: endospore germination permease [Ruminiclostridium sp.]|nr:endospore germination permease [Ruminiclostridium sp.]